MKSGQYRGKLSANQIARGINSAISNAKRLIEDAELLLQNKRYPTAIGLAILALEEAGKVSILRELSTANNDGDVNKAWKAYRTHTKKNMWLSMPQLVASGARSLEDFRTMVTDSEFPDLVETLKQISFYTDCLGNAHWSVPIEVANEELAKHIISVSKLMIESKHEVTEKEIQIWMKHMGPVWKQDMERMKAALEDYYIEMHKVGLYKGDLEDALVFIHGNKFWKH